MKWYWPSILYMNCMSRSSRSGFSTLSPLRKVCSITAPVFRFLSFVRTKAPPFPGFTCWKKTMTKGARSNSIFRPLRKSDVVYIPRGASSNRWFARLGEERDPFEPRSGDPHRVLQPDPPDPGEIDAGFHRDHHPLLEPLARPGGKRRPLVNVKPNAVSGRMNKILQIS